MEDIKGKTGNKRIGKQFEEYASSYLKNNGYQILERNYRFRRFGEVDIIAIKNGVLCFVEVKSRQNDSFGTPAESVTYKKKKKIAFLADQYIALNKLSNKAVRFDVVEIYFSRGNNDTYTVKSINHIENAF